MSTRLFLFGVLLFSVGGGCSPEPDPSDADPSAAHAPGAHALDSLRTALDRWEAASSPSDADRASVRRWADSLWTTGDSLQAHRPERARVLLEGALRGSRALGDSSRIATTLGDIGGTYYFQSRYDDALAHWRDALSAHRALGQSDGAARTLNNIGIVHARQGRPEEALARYQESLDIERAQNDRTGTAAALNNIGLLYQNQGRYDKALAYYEKSLELERVENDRDGIAASLNNIGLIYQNQGRYDKALAQYQESLTIERAQDDRSGVATSLNNIGLIYKNQGRYDKALARYQESVAIKRELGNRDDLAGTLNNIGQIFFRQGRYDEALSRYRNSLSVHQDLGNQGGVATSLSSIGQVRLHQGRYSEALAAYEEALALERELENRSGIARLLNQIGTVYRRQGRPEAALARHREADSLRREMGETESLAQTLNAMGESHADQDRPEAALRHYREALRLNQEMGRRADLARSLENIAAIHLRRGRAQAAIDTLEWAVSVAEEVRRSATSPEARRSLLSTQTDAYQALTTGYVRSGRPQAALRAFERGRSRLLDTRLDEAASPDTTSAAPAVQRALGPNEAALLYTNPEPTRPLTALVVTRDTVQARELPDSTFRANLAQQYADPLRQLRRRNGPLVDALRAEPKPASDALPTLAEAVRLYRHRLTEVEGTDSAQRDLARRLYDVLVAPLSPDIRGTNTVTVVPSGVLGYLPLEALRAPNGAYLIEQTQVRYVQSLTMLRQLQNRTYPDPARPLLALGGPDYGPSEASSEPPLLAEVRSDSAIATREHASSLLRTAERRLEQGRSPRPTYAQLGYRSWPALSGTKLEVEKLRRTAGREATVLTGADVSEGRVRRMSETGRLSTYRRVHFATHGIAIPEAPALSALVLSQAGASDSLAVRDGYLTMQEIAELNLQADVAVLSACRTGLGRVVAGSGVLSLSNAFLQAGANATVASQWRVRDWSTQQFMTSVYRTAGDGVSFSDALTRVKRQFIAGTFGGENTDPAQWAPFVYYGRR